MVDHRKIIILLVFIKIRQNNKWYHCDDKHITEANLLVLSNNVYLVFYAKEIDIGT